MRRIGLVVSVLVVAIGSVGMRAASAQPEGRTLTISSSSGEVKRGEAVVLSGRVQGPPACTEGVLVAIEFDIGDDLIMFSQIGETVSEQGGSFQETVIVSTTGSFRARVDASDSCSSATSSPTFVLTQVDVALTAPDNTVPAGTRATLIVTVSPRCRPEFISEGQAPPEVELYRFIRGNFVKVASKVPAEDCTATFRRRVRTTEVFKAGFPRLQSLHYSYAAGSSELLPVGVSG